MTLIVAVTLVGMRACADPIDISRTLTVPSMVDDWKKQDGLAYPVHILLGRILNQAGCSPVAAGLQWIKAGAHVRTDLEVREVARGLAATRDRSDRAGNLDVTLCSFVARGFARPQQEAAMRQAGLRCVP